MNAQKEVVYNSNGQVEKIIDFNGVITEHKYDSLKRLISKTQAKGTNEEAITQYSYDKNSNLLSITNAKGAKK